MNRFCLCFTAALVSLPAAAAQVGELTPFTAGTPARAAEVNGNFNALKSAVDDNDARLTSVESAKQNRITGTCLPGSAVTEVAADGTVTCGALQQAGVIAIPYLAFSGCTIGLANYQGAYPLANVYACTLTVPLYLPNSVTISGLSCLANDATGSAHIGPLKLMRQSLTSGGTPNIVADSIGSATTSNAGMQTLSAVNYDSIYTTVNNNTHMYWLEVDLAATSSSTFLDINTSSPGSLSLYGCTVTYTP